MYRIIKCIVQGKQARVKNADLRHMSCSTTLKMRIYYRYISLINQILLNDVAKTNSCFISAHQNSILTHEIQLGFVQ